MKPFLTARRNPNMWSVCEQLHATGYHPYIMQNSHHHTTKGFLIGDNIIVHLQDMQGNAE